MTQTEINTNNRNGLQPQDDDSIDLKKLIFKFLRNWFWFVLAVIVSVGLAFLYNRYKTPVYEINASMLVEEGKNTSPLSGSLGSPQQNIFQGLGGMNSMQNIYNQMVILNSTPIVSRTLDELDFEVSYYAVGRVSVTERYKEVPFQVMWDKNHPQIIEGDFDLTILPSGKLQISMNEVEVIVYDYQEDEIIQRIPEFSFSREVEAGSKLTSDQCSFTILLNEQFKPDAPNNFKFRFHSKS